MVTTHVSRRSGPSSGHSPKNRSPFVDSQFSLLTSSRICSFAAPRARCWSRPRRLYSQALSRRAGGRPGRHVHGPSSVSCDRRRLMRTSEGVAHVHAQSVYRPLCIRRGDLRRAGDRTQPTAIAARFPHQRASRSVREHPQSTRPCTLCRALPIAESRVGGLRDGQAVRQHLRRRHVHSS